MEIINVPEEFQQSMPFRYPMHQQGAKMERRIHTYLSSMEVKSDWTYLPIYWTPYWTSHEFGNLGKAELQKFCESIDYKNKKIFTVVEYADGILLDQLPYPLHVFQCGKAGGTTLPLLCDEHPACIVQDPTLTASFIGAIRYPIRSAMKEALADRPGFYVGGMEGTVPFRTMMANSWFALAPRGYGATSYRLYEAMQIGCIPVYIYDEKLTPYWDELNWHEFCVMVHESEVPKLADMLNSYSTEQKLKMRKRVAEVYRSHFSWRGTFEWVKRWLEA